MILLSNISKRYGDKIILNNLSYEFENNKCYLIKGSSGIGKTTLLNILGGYVLPDSGYVSFSEDQSIQYMFQEELLFSNLTVLENMAIKYYATHPNENWDLMQINNATKEIVDFFDLSVFLERRIDTLSGGERQRVVLATMAVSDASIYLMDEPVTNLDEENRNIICDLINRLSEKRTIIIVSHIALPKLDNAVHLTLKGGTIVEEY